MDHEEGPTNGKVVCEDSKPTYALGHLATFKVKHESEIRNPKEKLKVLIELDKSGAIWPQNMYMSFNGQWVVMLDSDMKEIENFPGSLITEPTAFISEDPDEIFNNILIFTVSGVSLGTTEMHVFQVTDVSAKHLVEDLRQLSSGNVVTIDRNLALPKVLQHDKQHQNGRDQYGIAVAAAEVAAEKNAHEREHSHRDIQVLNHCFEDIERFVARLQYAAEALRELEFRQNEHTPHGEGLLVLRSRPPTESEFHDILSKLKLAINYVVKLQNHFSNATEPIYSLFISLYTVVNICNDVHVGANIPENVINPLLRRETIQFLTGCLNVKNMDFWRSLGENWTMAKEHHKDHRGAYHPIFYDDWSPDWVVDEEVAYIPLPKITISPSIRRHAASNTVWLSRLQSRNVKIAEVVYDNNANNDRELNVTKGEYLEVIDNSRNWWKTRNSTGSVGYVPHTVLKPFNFEQQSNYPARDTYSTASSVLEQETFNWNENDNHTLPYTLPSTMNMDEHESVPQTIASKSMPRSYSMPNVPIPPPLPPSDSEPPTPSGTLERNMAAARNLSAIRARSDNETNDEVRMLQGTVNDELRATLYQRERRRDLEILTTPNIYINQNSSPREVEEWLRGKGFSNVIVAKLGKLNGEDLFALAPHVIEGYFGQAESRRLISQIVLQKNICEYKTIRSTELSTKLAKARQKADQQGNDLDEIF